MTNIEHYLRAASARYYGPGQVRPRRLSVRALAICCLFLAASAVFAAKPQANKDDLRRLACLPPMSFEMGAKEVRGQLRWKQDVVTSDQIAKLRKELHGDSTDALRLLRLGDLLWDAGLTNQANLAYSNSVSAFRRQVEMQPQVGQLLSHLGEALDNTDHPEEAEAVLRRAVILAPKDPECWRELGYFLNDRSEGALYPYKVPPDLSDSPVLLVTKFKPTGEQFERAQKLSKESLECYDRAISLAPKDPALLEYRAFAVGNLGFIRTIKQQIVSSQPDESELALSMFSPDCVPDLRRAAELDPENPSRLAAVAMVEAMSATFRANKTGGFDPTSQKVWDIRGKLDRLTEMTEHPSKEKAAQAAMYLAVLQLTIMGDKHSAEANFRRAVALNPKNDQAWELLMVIVGEEKSYHEMVKVAEARVKAVPSSRAHLCLAKAHEKLNHWDKVVDETETAVKAAPNDILPKLALLSALIRTGDERIRKAAADLLELEKEKSPQANKDLQVHQLFLAGLQSALEDEVEQGRTFLNLALKLKPDHEGAKAALAIIDNWK